MCPPPPPATFSLSLPLSASLSHVRATPAGPLQPQPVPVHPVWPRLRSPKTPLPVLRDVTRPTAAASDTILSVNHNFFSSLFLTSERRVENSVMQIWLTAAVAAVTSPGPPAFPAGRLEGGGTRLLKQLSSPLRDNLTATSWKPRLLVFFLFYFSDTAWLHSFGA